MSEKYCYNVLFHVTGVDHADGYCSGLDGDHDGDDIDQMEKKIIVRNSTIHKLRDLNHVTEGCTSASSGYGSGYCTNMKKRYKAIAILEFNSFLEPTSN